MNHASDRDQAQLLGERGELVPAHMTEALAVAELFGSEVDLDCEGRRYARRRVGSRHSLPDPSPVARPRRAHRPSSGMVRLHQRGGSRYPVDLAAAHMLAAVPRLVVGEVHHEPRQR